MRFATVHKKCRGTIGRFKTGFTMMLAPSSNISDPLVGNKKNWLLMKKNWLATPLLPKEKVADGDFPDTTLS